MFEHDPDLVFAAFMQPHLIPGVVPSMCQLDLCGRGSLAVHVDPRLKLLLLVVCQRSIYLDCICLLYVRSRRCDSISEFAIVSEKQQTFAVVVEPSDRIHARLNTA